MTRIKFITIFLLMFSTTLSFGQKSISANQGYATSEKYFTVIPYSIIKGKIIIEVTVSDKKRKFILDTGAPTAISNSLYLELQPALLGKVEIADQSGAKDSISVVTMPDIETGDIIFSGIPAIVIQESKAFLECFGVDGFIGSNLLRNSAIQFDSKTKTITITDNPKLLNLKKKHSSKMELSAVQSNPFIWIKIKKDKRIASERVLFDTGDDGFYKLSISAYRQLTNSQLNMLDKIGESEGSFSAGLLGIAEKASHYAVNVPILTINDMEYKNISAKTTYAETSRLGSDVLNYGTITLDYMNKKFYFESFDKKETINMNEKIWAIDPVIEGDKIVVGIIWDESLKNRINIGDQILSFDNIDYQSMDFCQIVTSNSEIEKDKAIIILKDKISGNKKTVEISKM